MKKEKKITGKSRKYKITNNFSKKYNQKKKNSSMSRVTYVHNINAWLGSKIFDGVKKTSKFIHVNFSI